MPDPLPSLAEVFAGMSDWRKPKGKRYEIGMVLTVTFLALLSGENSVRGIGTWVKEQRRQLSRALGLKRSRMPGYETIRTVLRDLDIAELERRWHDGAEQVAAAYRVENWPGLALDGKTLRGSRAGDQAAVHLLSAFLHELELVMGQHAVAGKTNEIPIARDLLETLTLKGVLITCDALHTQRKTAELIVEKGGPI
jgi:hypothetical protein